MNIKTNRLVWMLSILAVMIIAGVWLVRSQQVNQQKQLLGELSTTVKKLNLSQTDLLQRQKSEMENRLSTANARLETEAARLFSTTESISASDLLFETAASVGVEVLEIKSGGMMRESVQGITMQSLPLNIKIEGDLENLFNFVFVLSKNFPTGVVKSVELDAPDLPGLMTTDPRSKEVKVRKPSASVNLAIYTYQGEG